MMLLRMATRRARRFSLYTCWLCRVSKATFGAEAAQWSKPSKGLCGLSADLVPSTLSTGQPTPETHPEVLAPGEIMPGVTADEISSRRKALMSKLPKESLAIINSATIKYMTDVVPYPFRQDANYFYYTGCQQVGGIAVIESTGDLCMFVPDPDPERAVWEGYVADTGEAINHFKADHAFFMGQLSEVLTPKLKKAKGVYVDKTPFCGAASKLCALKEALQGGKVHDIKQYSDEVRWVKSSSEINLMRHSAAIASQAFLETMKLSRIRPHEHLLAATIECECKIRGAHRMAFPPVVGGGANGTVIHYSRNDQWIKREDLVLLDAGCEYFGYVSDITRTWSPSGYLSDAQRELYEIILSTSKECIKLCQPGVTLRKLHQCATDMLQRAAKDLGLIKRREDFLKINPTYIGHFLGLDVHDCGSISKDQKLRPGVVLTVEPGLYIPQAEDIPRRFHGIGIRIEDDILITDSGHEVLTNSIPKELNQIEAWIQC